MNLKPKNQWQRLLPYRARQAVLTMHIMMSVGLLGDAAGFLAVALGAARTDNADAVVELVKVLNMFSLVFGIPLSFGAQARARWNSSKIPPVQELFPVCVRTQN